MQRIQFDHFHGMEAGQYSFYRIPKMLFTAECFRSLSCEAKVLYGLMLDRMGLSIKNRWIDEEDRVYIVFTVEETAEFGKQALTVKPMEGAALSEQLKEAVSHIQGDITDREPEELLQGRVGASIPADPSVKNFSFAEVSGKVYYRENARMNPVELPAKTAERVLGMVKLRDTTQELIRCQMEDKSDVEVEALQKKLDMEYDSFTKKYGLISSNANRRAFSQDSGYCLLVALELVDENGNLERKADIFTKRTIRKAEPVTSVDTASEALAVSIGEKARVDIPFMAELCGKTEEEATRELTGVIFKNPVTEKWEAADEYLSGNVREKLRTAGYYAENHPEYAPNVEYLKKVQPKDRRFGDRGVAGRYMGGGCLYHTVHGGIIPDTGKLSWEKDCGKVCERNRAVVYFREEP